MSEWKRHRGSKSMPKCLVGKKYEAMRRDGTIAAFVNSWIHNGWYSDVMKYRILPSEPAAEPAKPDCSKGFPRGTTAKDIGAKVGDQFVMISKDHHSVDAGEILSLLRDDGTAQPFFNDSNGELRCSYWHRLAPAPQKTAIELQAEEVGIPEPVRHVAGEWIEWKGGISPVEKGTPVDVRYRDGKENIGMLLDDQCVWDHHGNGLDITAYRLHQPQEWPEDRIDVIGQNGSTGDHYEIDTSPERVEKQEEIVHITPADVRVTVDLGIDAPKSAPEFLQSALSTLTQRGKDYDKPEGERSAAAVAVAFNAITGRNLTEAEVWLVLQLVKDVRQWQNPERYHADSALDCVAYAALKAEALAGGGKQWSSAAGDIATTTGAKMG